jgi:hypothetical protein
MGGRVRNGGDSYWRHDDAGGCSRGRDQPRAAGHRRSINTSGKLDLAFTSRTWRGVGPAGFALVTNTLFCGMGARRLRNQFIVQRAVVNHGLPHILGGSFPTAVGECDAMRSVIVLNHSGVIDR